MENIEVEVELEEIEEEVTPIHYNVTVHALERYAERVARQSNITITDIKGYANNHREVFRERINKLINYSELIFEGSIREYNQTKVYFKDNYIILVSSKDNNVVTLYKVDLGDDEATELFVTKKLKQLKKAQAERKVIADVKEVDQKIRDIIDNLIYEKYF